MAAARAFIDEGELRDLIDEHARARQQAQSDDDERGAPAIRQAFPVREPRARHAQRPIDTILPHVERRTRPTDGG